MTIADFEPSSSTVVVTKRVMLSSRFRPNMTNYLSLKLTLKPKMVDIYKFIEMLADEEITWIGRIRHTVFVNFQDI